MARDFIHRLGLAMVLCLVILMLLFAGCAFPRYNGDALAPKNKTWWCSLHTRVRFDAGHAGRCWSIQRTRLTATGHFAPKLISHEVRQSFRENILGRSSLLTQVAQPLVLAGESSPALDGVPWDKLAEDFQHLVLVNEEEQYSIWRGGTPIPAGRPVAQGGCRITAASTRSGTKPRPGSGGAQPTLECFRLPGIGGDAAAVPFPK